MMTAGSVKEDAAGRAAPRGGSLAWSRRLTRWALVGFVALDPISITLSQICVAVGVLSGAVGWTLERRGGEGGARRGSDGFPLWIPFLCFALLTVLSALFSEQVPRSLVDSKQIVQILILYWALRAAPDVSWARRLLHLFVLVAAATAILGVAQFFLAEGRPLARRPQGILSHVQTFSGVLLLATLPALSLAVGRGVSRPERIFGVVTSAVLIFGLLVSLTRGAWIGLAAGVAVLLALHGRARWLVLLPVLAVGLYVVGPADLKERLLLTVRFDEEASGERLRMWKAGLRMMRAHPFLGVGVDMVGRTYPRFRVEGAVKARTGHLHSNPVHLGAERGLPALAVWIWIWAAFFRWGGGALRRTIRREGRTPRAEIAAAGLAAVAAFLTAGLFEYNFGDSEVVMMVYFLMALPFISAAEDGASKEFAPEMDTRRTRV